MYDGWGGDGITIQLNTTRRYSCTCMRCYEASFLLYHVCVIRRRTAQRNGEQLNKRWPILLISVNVLRRYIAWICTQWVPFILVMKKNHSTGFFNLLLEPLVNLLLGNQRCLINNTVSYVMVTLCTFVFHFLLNCKKLWTHLIPSKTCCVF